VGVVPPRLPHPAGSVVRGLATATLLALKYLARDDAATLADDLWARIVYDFALGYRLHVMNRGHLLRALTPLYLAGWRLRARDERRAFPGRGTEGAAALHGLRSPEALSNLSLALARSL